jgi:DNA-binding PucR family transcriptional regulator
LRQFQDVVRSVEVVFNSSDDLVAPLRLADREWKALRATLIAWGNSGFNITRAAEQLRLHRNTLIYRLDTIAREFCGGHSTNPVLLLASA